MAIVFIISGLSVDKKYNNNESIHVILPAVYFFTTQ